MNVSLKFALGLLLLLPAGRAAAAGCGTTTWAGSVVQTWEAEAGSLSAPMAVSAAAGISSIHSGTHNDTNSSPGSCAANGCASFSFLCPATGQYKVEALVDAPSGSNDSFYFEIVGAADVCGGGAPRWDVTNSGSGFNWRYITDNDNNNNANHARIWQLTSGVTYTLRVYGREQGTYMDQIRVRQDPAIPTPVPSATSVPPAPTSTPTPSGLPGLCMTVYTASKALSGASFQVVSPVAKDWGAGGPKAGVTDTFSVRWTGSVRIPQNGVFQFATYSDEGVRLWLDGVLLVDSWANQAALTRTAAPAFFLAGLHALQLEYYEDTGNALCFLSWRGPGIAGGAGAWQAVPAGALASNCAAAIVPVPTAAPTVYSGLAAAARLYGLEYIPFPLQAGGFFDVGKEYSGSASAIPKNTARYHIKLKPSVVGAIGASYVSVETRLGPGGEACQTGFYNPANYASSTSMQLPPVPQNLSTTYFWYDGNSVPFTEQIDAMGDPRHVPYQDTLAAGNYNWFFQNLGDSSHPGYFAAYAAYAPLADFDSYNNQPNIDVPKLFRLWREGVLRTRSVYTSMTGYSGYYMGVGGEFGGDSSNDLNSHLLLSKQPFSPASSSGFAGYDEIIYDGAPSAPAVAANTGARLVRNASWRSMPFLGELFPDAAYVSDWKFNAAGTNLGGNLRNPSAGGSAYRDLWSNMALNQAGPPEIHSWFPPAGTSEIQHRNSGDGCMTFMNGNGGSGFFGHVGVATYNAARLNDGDMMGAAYNFSVEDPFTCNRPWNLNAAATAPDGYGSPPYAATRCTLDVYSATTVTSAEYGFYQYLPSASGVNHTSMKASAAVRAYDASGNVGWFIINGLAPSTTSGINYVARFALLSCLRTFQDAGVPTRTASSNPFSLRNMVGGAPARIEPLPWIKIYRPATGDDVTKQSQVTLRWTERYARWDGGKYTESYPCLDSTDGANPLNNQPCSETQALVQNKAPLEWHSEEPLTYNIKYSSNGGGSWNSAMTGAPCAAGVMLTPSSETYTPASSLHDHSYTWNVGSLSSGNKLVRVECYRQNIPSHYAYHELVVNTSAP
jgi:hypothetical protein